ncbi:MAG: F-box protein [Verrucomicrobia bacterium]|nr:F-box protein [Verrucomicrobiota bacterium]
MTIQEISAIAPSLAANDQREEYTCPADPKWPCPINELPNELLQRIFSYLPFVDQSRVALVCKKWLPNVREAAWKKVTLIDPSVWEKNVNLQGHSLSFEGLEFPSREILEPVALDLTRHVERDQGVSIFPIPKGLAFFKLLTIAEEKSVRPKYIWRRVMRGISNIETERPYVIVVSNSVLKGSREKTYEERDALIQSMGYEVPSTTELLMGMVFHYMMYSKRLFGNDPWTFSQTSDSVDGCRLAVGGFAPPGFIVSDANDGNYDGVAGLRRF